MAQIGENVINYVTQFASNHPGVLFLIGSSAVLAMPSKGTKFSWGTAYDFIFDWFHGLLGNRYQPAQSSSSLTMTPNKTEATTTTSEPLPKP